MAFQVQLAVPIYPVAGEHAKTARHGVVAEMKRVLDGQGRVNRRVLAEMKKVYGTHVVRGESRLW